MRQEVLWFVPRSLTTALLDGQACLECRDAWPPLCGMIWRVGQGGDGSECHDSRRFPGHIGSFHELRLQ